MNLRLLVQDGDGYLLLVVPADYCIELESLRKLLGAGGGELQHRSKVKLIRPALIHWINDPRFLTNRIQCFDQ